MKIRTLIAEDDLSQRNVLLEYARGLNLEVISTVSSGTRIVEEVLSKKPDLLLLDISLMKLNGLEAYKRILEMGLSPHVIFISGSLDSHHLVGAFEYDSLDYIVKPFTFERFSKAINKARNAIQARSLIELPTENPVRWIKMKQKYRELRLKEDQIILVEKNNLLRNKSLVYLSNGNVEETSTQLSEIKESCSDMIVYSHRSYLINLMHVVGILPDQVIPKNFVIQFERPDITAPLTRKYYREIRESYERLKGR
ncbi:LytTR family DNA-binding domain-containing protein [Paenibacillus sp. Y412MC10]|uniref:LytR/AlgR family response regulator transcription factor n=1 Tax=Geobacillus sp. (strain Y412MC10) TaxID=481743 RepID=UPI0016434EEE|nr:LytTR family DNA-binding domain-containing protein [Paenibacillus sp. Y412MC10]